MTELSGREIQQLKDLLRHTGEFIAYFELAETKLVTWRHQQEASFCEQKQAFDTQHDNIKKDLECLKETLSDAGIARLKTQLNEAIALFESKLDSVDAVKQTIEGIFTEEKNSLSQSVRQFKQEIAASCQTTIDKIESQLADYDVDHFRRVASDSCDQVEQVAQTTVQSSRTMMRNFQWRTVTMMLIMTLITAITIGLYVSDEWPWELHQQAMNEREAGKILIKAWPSLSHKERERILTHDVAKLG